MTCWGTGDGPSVMRGGRSDRRPQLPVELMRSKCATRVLPTSTTNRFPASHELWPLAQPSWYPAVGALLRHMTRRIRQRAPIDSHTNARSPGVVVGRPIATPTTNSPATELASGAFWSSAEVSVVSRCARGAPRSFASSGRLLTPRDAPCTRRGPRGLPPIDAVPASRRRLRSPAAGNTVAHASTRRRCNMTAGRHRATGRRPHHVG